MGSNPDAVSALKAELEKAEKLKESMGAVNGYYRQNQTLDGCTDMSADEIETLKAAMELARSWGVELKPFDSYAINSNNAAIRRLKAQFEGLSHQPAATIQAVPEVDSQSSAENRLSAEFYEVAWLCAPAPPEDSAARAAQISGLTQLLCQEGQRAANQMLLSVASFVAGSEVSENVKARASHLMTELARYGELERENASRQKIGHKKSQER